MNGTNQAKELKTISTLFSKGILAGRESKNFCYMVSAALCGYLKFCGYNCHLQKGDIKISKNVVLEHYWIKMNDGNIVDATADQYNNATRKMPRVYVGNKPVWYKEEE
jgi:hypothetical protein